jgi:hypothetical protein
MSYRQKIVISQVALFSFFILLSLPFIERSVEKVQLYSLNQFAMQLTSKLQKCSSEEEMISTVKNIREDVFSRVNLYDHKLSIDRLIEVCVRLQ